MLFERFDIVNAVDLDSLLPAYLISNWKGKACVYDAHEYFTETPEVVRRPWIKKWWERLADFVVPKLTHCYTVGPALAKIMGERYGVKFGVIRNLPFPQREMVKPSESQPLRLLYQGALNEGRGLFEVIQAMDQLKYVQLWIAGEGDLSEFLRKEVDLRRLKDQVTFLGYLQPEELKEVTYALGAEYMYNSAFALRIGYFHESPDKGNRQFFTLGAGFKTNSLNIDLSYLMNSSDINNPLENSLRFSLSFDLGEIYNDY